MRNRLLIVTATLVAVAACTPVDYGFGESTRANIAQQVVDPDPQYEGQIMEGGSGQRGAAAVDRYNRGEVKQPSRMTTTGASGSSSSSSSGSSQSGGPQ
jgi:type IV pilus biogenesis protein CpaD/CtpE